MEIRKSKYGTSIIITLLAGISLLLALGGLVIAMGATTNEELAEDEAAIWYQVGPLEITVPSTLYWQNLSTGRRLVWFMEEDGFTRKSFEDLSPSPTSTNWRIAATGN